MRKTLLFKQLALAAALAVPVVGNGQKVLVEDFAYSAGNLVGQGDWTQILSAATNPLQVAGEGLIYPDYQDESIGGSATFQSTGQDAYLPFGRDITSGDVYVSALVRLSAVQTGNFFFAFGQGEGYSSDLRGRLFAKASDNGKIQFGVAQQASSVTHYQGRQAQFAATEYELDSIVLVVMKYSFIEGDNNDLVSLYINPNPATPEPETASITSANEVLANGDAEAINSIAIYQMTSSSAPTGDIDAIRVSTTWAGLFDDSTVPVLPELTFSPSFAYITDGNSYNVFAGETYPFTFNVKAANLQSDIEVKIKGASGGELTTETTSIAQAQAESAEGFDLTVMLKPQSEYNYTDTVQFITTGIDTVEYSIMWTTAVPQTATTLADLKAQYAELGEYEAPWVIFKLTGEVTVSHVYMNGDAQQLYIQDETGGILVNDNLGSLTTQYKTGDKLSNLLFTAESSFGSMYLLPSKDFGAPISQGNTVEPATLTLAELAANGARYYGCLVKVENVTFEMGTNEEGIVTEGKFGDEGLFVHIVQDGNKASINDLPGADFVGKNVPASARSIIGISTSATGSAIAPRSLADIDADFDEPGGEEPGTEPEEPGNETEVGDNLFLDHSFENGRSSILGVSFDDWNVTSGALENEIVTDGEAALRITGSNLAKIEQEIGALAHTFTEGDAYALTINYYVVASQGNNDVQLNCAWGGIDVGEYDTDLLTQGFSGALNTWESKRVRMVVPAGRQISFQFNLNVPAGAEVIFDNFSLYKLEAITTGLEAASENGLSAWAEGGVLYLGSDRAQTVDVYGLNGVLISRTNLTPGVNALALPAGAYVLKADDQVQKVFVK